MLEKKRTGIILPALAPLSEEQILGAFPGCVTILDLAPTNEVELYIARIVRGDESFIHSNTYLKRLRGESPLGLQHARWLAKHLATLPVGGNPDDGAQKLRKALVVDGLSLDFPGLQLYGPDRAVGMPSIGPGPKPHAHAASMAFACHRLVCLAGPA